MPANCGIFLKLLHITAYLILLAKEQPKELV